MKTYHLLTLVLSMFVVIITLSAARAYSQPKFERMDSVQLSEAEQRLLSGIRSRETTKEAHLVRVTDMILLAEANYFDLSVSGQTVRFERNANQSILEDGFNWVGKVTEKHGEILLFFNDGYLHGMIHLGSVTINIEPINREFVVFTQLIESAFGICPVEGEEYTGGEESRKEKNPGSGNSEIQSTDPIIDVMVVYTQASAQASGNIQSLVNGSIQSTNTTLQNSGINATVNLVHSAQINYTETGNLETDINRLRGTSDGYMDIVHSWRDQYGADIVVLLTDSGDSCGIAYWIEVPSNDALQFLETIAQLETTLLPMKSVT